MNYRHIYESFERYEFKYLLKNKQRYQIESDISNFMKLDNFALEKKGYFVRSLYFDDDQSTEYYNKTDGMLIRKKFRLRTYSKYLNNDIPIYMEIKGRNNQRTFKNRTKIDYNDLALYEQCELENLIKKKDVINIEFLFQIFRRSIKPKIVTDYWRSPYISYDDGNFRLTFDNQNTIKKTNKLFNNQEDYRRSVLPGYSILEIKFDRRIPKWFHRIIQNYNLNRMSISKFCMGMEKADIAINLE
jgi:hypothetical protein